MVSILISTDTRYPVNRKIIRKAIYDVLAQHKIENIDTEISVAVVGRRKMNHLGSKFLKDKVTHEVLAFALEEVGQDIGFINSPDELLRLGDIVICWSKVLEAASRDDVMVDDELYYLTSHGMMHLLGEHHG